MPFDGLKISVLGRSKFNTEKITQLVFPGGSVPAGIVQDGLIWYLNASKPYSYPGTGVTWFDIKQSYDGTLQNGIAFSTDNGGCFDFDGIDDYVSAPIKSLRSITGAESSLCVWFRVSNTTTRQCILGDWTITGLDETCRLEVSGWQITSGKVGGLINSLGGNATPVQTISTISANTWYYVVIQYDGANTNLYLNGVIQQQLASTERGSNGTGDTAIGRGGGYNGLYFGGDVAQVQVYNRALTADEVLANFDIDKSMYGY